MSCELCDIVAGESKAVVLYEDEKVFVAVRDHVLIPGQITVFPREHAPILEMIPDEILGHCAILANTISVAVFETLGAKGTNILIRNGLGAGQNLPHFSIEVIPRQENDGLNFQWEPKQILEDEIDRTFVLLKDELASLQEQSKKVKEEERRIEEKGKENNNGQPKEEKQKEKEKPNYLLKSVRKIP